MGAVPAIAIGLSLTGLVLLADSILSFKRKRVSRGLLSLLVCLLFASCASLAATILVSSIGYRALTKEEVAATVQILPLGDQSFQARFRFPDDQEKTFRLAGDEFYVDAHILKWKSVGNLIGLHTLYELDRVGGRYRQLEDEKYRERTLFSLKDNKPLDLFNLARKYRFLNPFIDAEYGSATFTTAAQPDSFKIMVSTTGLLVRTIE